MSEYQTILLEEKSPHVSLLTFNRPERANAMNTQMGIELRQVFTDYYVDSKDTRCLVVTGAGDKIFCAGGDLPELGACPTAGSGPPGSAGPSARAVLTGACRSACCWRPRQISRAS